MSDPCVSGISKFLGDDNIEPSSDSGSEVESDSDWPRNVYINHHGPPCKPILLLRQLKSPSPSDL